MDEDPDDSNLLNGFRINGYLSKASLRSANNSFSTDHPHHKSEGFVNDDDYERLEKIRGLTAIFDEVLFWCWNVKCADGSFKVRTIRSAQNNFLIMTALVKPEILDGMSYEEIGMKAGITRQNISRVANDFQNEFGLTFRRSRPTNGSHAIAAKKAWEKRRE